MLSRRCGEGCREARNRPLGRALPAFTDYSAFVIMLVSLLSALFVIPLGYNYLFPPVFASAQQPAYVLQSVTVGNWTDTFDLEVSFDVPPQFIAGADAVVRIFFYFENGVDGITVRYTTATWSLYCNGQYVSKDSEATSANAAKFSGRDDLALPSSFLKSQDNQVKIHGDVESVTFGAEHYSLLFRTDKIEVKLQNPDASLLLFWLGFAGFATCIIIAVKEETKIQLPDKADHT